MLCLSISAFAYDFEVNGIRYEIISLDDMTCKVIANTEKYAGAISIPASVEYNGRSFNIIAIGDKAFQNCTEVSELHLESASELSEIGSSAFKGCTSLTTVTIPSQCNILGYNAFFGCSSLKTIIIPESSTPLTLNPKDLEGKGVIDSYNGHGISFHFGQFVDCPVEQLELHRDIAYGGQAIEFKELGTDLSQTLDFVRVYPWIKSCAKDLIIGKEVTKIPYNLLLTVDPINFYIEDDDSPLTIEPLSFWRYLFSDDIYYMDECIYIKGATHSSIVEHLFWGLKFPHLQKVYWGRPINTTDFEYSMYAGWGEHEVHTVASKSISLVSDSLITFEYGKELSDIGRVQSVSSENLTNIKWNDCLETCHIFKSTPKIADLKFPNSLKEISGFESEGTLNNVYFGSELSVLSGFQNASIRDIYITAVTPPVTRDSTFNDKIFIDSKLHVPTGCKSIYSTSNVWSKFWNILEGAESGLSDLEVDTPITINAVNEKINIKGKEDTDIVCIYNAEGQLIVSTNDNEIQLDTHGMYIIKVGSVCKKIVL